MSHHRSLPAGVPCKQLEELLEPQALGGVVLGVEFGDLRGWCRCLCRVRARDRARRRARGSRQREAGGSRGKGVAGAAYGLGGEGGARTFVLHVFPCAAPYPPSLHVRAHACSPLPAPPLACSLPPPPQLLCAETQVFQRVSASQRVLPTRGDTMILSFDANIIYHSRKCMQCQRQLVPSGVSQQWEEGGGCTQRACSAVDVNCHATQHCGRWHPAPRAHARTTGVTSKRSALRRDSIFLQGGLGFRPTRSWVRTACTAQQCVPYARCWLAACCTCPHCCTAAAPLPPTPSHTCWPAQPAGLKRQKARRPPAGSNPLSPPPFPRVPHGCACP